MILNLWTGGHAVFATPSSMAPAHPNTQGRLTLYFIKTEYQSWLLWVES